MPSDIFLWNIKKHVTVFRRVLINNVCTYCVMELSQVSFRIEIFLEKLEGWKERTFLETKPNCSFPSIHSPPVASGWRRGTFLVFHLCVWTRVRIPLGPEPTCGFGFQSLLDYVGLSLDYLSGVLLPHLKLNITSEVHYLPFKGFFGLTNYSDVCSFEGVLDFVKYK